MSYELHRYDDDSFKIKFHLDRQEAKNRCITHWHEHPEILYFISGSGTVRSDEVLISASKGDVIIISPGRLHEVSADTCECVYYCLIPNIEYMSGITGLPVKSNSTSVIDIYKNIIDEFDKKDNSYKQAIIGYVKVMFAMLSRANDADAEEESAERFQIVKQAINYMYEHLSDDISLDTMCSEIGVSKYYFSHVFRDITGQSAIPYLNYLRCQNAKKMIEDGIGISESAFSSGFHNLSYFSRTYKKLIGNLPSEEKTLLKRSSIAAFGNKDMG